MYFVLAQRPPCSKVGLIVCVYSEHRPNFDVAIGEGTVVAYVIFSKGQFFDARIRITRYPLRIGLSRVCL